MFSGPQQQAAAAELAAGLQAALVSPISGDSIIRFANDFRMVVIDIKGPNGVALQWEDSPQVPGDSFWFVPLMSVVGDSTTPRPMVYAMPGEYKSIPPLGTLGSANSYEAQRRGIALTSEIVSGTSGLHARSQLPFVLPSGWFVRMIFESGAGLASGESIRCAFMAAQIQLSTLCNL